MPPLSVCFNIVAYPVLSAFPFLRLLSNGVLDGVKEVRWILLLPLPFGRTSFAGPQNAFRKGVHEQKAVESDPVLTFRSFGFQFQRVPG